MNVCKICDKYPGDYELDSIFYLGKTGAHPELSEYTRVDITK